MEENLKVGKLDLETTYAIYGKHQIIRKIKGKWR